MNYCARCKDVLRNRAWLVAVLLVMLWTTTPAKADTRIIIRTTLGLHGLQQLCNTLPLPVCSVVGSLADPLNQLFLVTTPLNATTFLNLVRVLPGIVDAELDQLASLLGGLNRVTTPPAALSQSTLVTYYNSKVWNGYVTQPAAQIVRVAAAQHQFNVAGSGIVADIDTGVDPNHPAFAGLLLQGYDFTRNQSGASELNDLSPSDFPNLPPPCAPANCPPATVNQESAAILEGWAATILDTNPSYAAFGHGTMVMGVIHLVGPKARLLPLKAFSSAGTGYLSDILRAIYYANQNGAKIINMSFNLKTSSTELSSALDQANNSGVICAASAGNDGQEEVAYPAAFQTDVMGVASTTDLDTRSSFSNYGDNVVWVAAPGEAIVTTYPFSTYAAGWGTSFSTPFVSGGAALLLNLKPGTNESHAAADVAHAVYVGPDMGNGRLDLVRALSAARGDFSISVAPSSAAIHRGASQKITVTVTALQGFTGTVSMSVNGLPTNTSWAFSPSSVAGAGTSALTLQIGLSAPTGTYKLTIRGKSGSLVHSAHVTLTIR
jgi:Subtilase family